MDFQALDRRTFLGGIGALGGLGFLSGTAPGRGAGEDPRTLVLIQLSGGNDGLSTIVPHGDDAYYAARRSIAIDANEVLTLDDYRGFHPELERTRALYDEGRIAIVEGVGYPEPNRSHFKSFEIWHTADARGRASGEGWIGRLCSAVFADDVDPNRVVHVGRNVPYSLFSNRHPAATFTNPSGYRWVKNDDELAAVEAGVEQGSEKDDALAFLRARMSEARRSSAAIRAAAVRYRTPIEYPGDAFGDELRTLAALINGGIGARVLSAELGGFDTHNEQRGRHTQLMRRLDGALPAFLQDLARTEAGRAATVVVFSEFGRRVAENGSRGTDHGCAGPLVVAGARVEGGLYGEHPSLTELDEGDLVFSTDFRSVYATVIEATFDVPHEDVLGARYPLIDLI